MSTAPAGETLGSVLQGASEPVRELQAGSVWIYSPAYDLTFFILSPLVGLAVIQASIHSHLGPWFVFAATYLLGIPHYLSSFTFYLGEENLAYYWSRRAAFFLGPLLIVVAVVSLRVTQFEFLLMSAVVLWNIYHVSLQSGGILSLYRRLNHGPDSEKRWANLTILAVNATLVFWHVERFPAIMRTLQPIHPALPMALRRGFLLLAAGAGTVLLARLLSRTTKVSKPELFLLVSSLLLFHPFLWVEDVSLASLGMLTGHFLQYLAIVWLLNGRKYVTNAGPAAEHWLGRMGRNASLLVPVLAIIGLLVYATEKLSVVLGVSIVYSTLFYVLVFTHFYVDGLVWAFRVPYVRRSIGPYLIPQQPGPAV